MELTFAYPLSLGEWLVWIVAWVYVLTGLLFLFLPSLALRFFNVPQGMTNKHLYGPLRAVIGGFPLGLGVSYLMLAPQNLNAIALGFCAAGAAIGRLFSLLIDRSFSVANILFLILELICAYFACAYGFGWVL